MPMLFGMACVSKPLIILLFTEKWSDTIPYIQILSVACAIGMIGSVSLQTIKAVGRSDVILKLELIKKPVYLLLLLLGAIISPFAVAITMLMYNIYSSCVNSFQLSKVIKYSCGEQLRDLWNSFMLCMIMCAFVYPISFFDINYFLMIFLQVTLGVGLYFTLSRLTHNESYYAIIGILKEKIHGVK